MVHVGLNILWYLQNCTNAQLTNSISHIITWYSVSMPAMLNGLGLT
jgi:hypothetical protein